MARGKCPGSADNRNVKVTSCVLMINIVMVCADLNNINIIEKDESHTMKGIKAMCEAGDYKKTCVETVRESAGNISDTRKLIEVAFEVAMKNITEAGKRAKYLEEVQHEQRARKALRDCRELMKSAHLALQQSLDRMKGLDMTKVEDELEDLRVWLSAASTYQDTCLDGFENTTSNAAAQMRHNLNVSRRMTSNSLAIVTHLSAVLRPFERRLAMRRLSEVKPTFKFVVAKDGSGDFRTIRGCLNKLPRHSREAVVVHVKSGVYHEAVEIGHSMTHVVLVGDGPHNTKITGRRNFMDGLPTFRTSSFAVKGDFFVAKNIGFENSAGPAKLQAVALRVQSDMSIFYNCIIQGYQDTLYAHANRQFYRDCVISGTVDFVFGNAAAVFQNCTFKVRKPLDDQSCIVTAHGRTEKHQPTGFVIQSSTLVADREYYPVQRESKTYLGRPRKQYSRTIIMESYMDDLIDPKGWLPWEGKLGINTCDYEEVDNRGPGAHTSNRVKWKGLRHVSMENANNYTTDRFIQGDQWVNNSGVPYA